MKARRPLTKVQRERLVRFFSTFPRGNLDPEAAADEIERILGIPPPILDWEPTREARGPP